jgi:phosphoglycolate phosphatase
MPLAIFDFDGTLCATHEAITWALQRTFEDRGELAPDAAAIWKMIAAGIGVDESIRRLSPRALETEEINRWVARYRAIYDSDDSASRTRLFDGILELIERLSERRIPIVVVSNKGESAVRAAVERFGLARYLPLLVCDAPGLPRKPAPAVFDSRIRPLFPNVQRRDVWMVGDTRVDIAFARNIGARACWVAWGYGDPDECRALAPEAIAAHPGEVLGLF